MDLALAGGDGGNWIAEAGGCWKRIRLKKKTPPVCQYFRCSKSKRSHDPRIEDGKGQATPKRWKRLRAGIVGDGPFHEGRSDALGSKLRLDKRLRDAVPDAWEAKRSAPSDVEEGQ